MTTLTEKEVDQLIQMFDVLTLKSTKVLDLVFNTTSKIRIYLSVMRIEINIVAGHKVLSFDERT